MSHTTHEFTWVATGTGGIEIPPHAICWCGITYADWMTDLRDLHARMTPLDVADIDQALAAVRSRR
jgi:hypothetical protein